MAEIVKPTCGKTITGPIVKDRGRSRPLWRDKCRRKVKNWGDKCWQHGGPVATPAQPTPAGPTEEAGA